MNPTTNQTQTETPPSYANCVTRNGKQITPPVEPAAPSVAAAGEGERFRRALAFYANPETWEDCGYENGIYWVEDFAIWGDQGKVARDALGIEAAILPTVPEIVQGVEAAEAAASPPEPAAEPGAVVAGPGKALRYARLARAAVCSARDEIHDIDGIVGRDHLLGLAQATVGLADALQELVAQVNAAKEAHA